MDKIKVFFEKNTNFLYTLVVFSIFICFTAKWAFLSGRLGWEDESHFWIIIKNCSVAQIFELMKVEGHMMLWYLVVKPFTFLPYPYPMQIINWLFCLCAMIVLWKKAPFNYFIKTLIVFSPVFFQLYSVHARCYSISCFFLFLICALYKERLEKPYLFFLLLFLAANTHIQTLFASSAIGILFLYDLFKEKRYKELKIITTLTLCTGVMFLFQFLGVSKPDYENVVQDIVNSTNMVGMFFGLVPIENDNILLSKILASRLFVAIMTLVFATRFRAFFVYAFIYFTANLFFNFVYLPRYWHIAFFFVYFIVAYWIFLEEKPEQKYSKNFEYFVYAFLLILLQVQVELPHDKDFLYNVITNDQKLQNSKIFTDIWPITVSISLPKLNENGIYIYDMNGRNLSSFEGLMTYYDEDKKKFKAKNIYKYTDKNKNNYLVTISGISANNEYQNINKKIYIKGTKNGYPYFIYQILPPTRGNK